MVYRSADEALRRRREELVLERQLEVAALPDAISSVYVRRFARANAGVAGIAGAAMLVLCAALRQDGLTSLLQMTWVVMTGVYLLARLVAQKRLGLALARTFAPTESVEADVHRLIELRPATVVKDLAEELEWRSVALPMTALSLLVPLSLHYLVVALFHFGVPDTHEFDGWISLSLLCVGHCHIVLSAQAWRFAHALARTPDVFSVGLVADRSGWRAWGLTIASSVLAGMMLLVIVPIAGIAMMVVPIAGIALVIVAPAVVAVTGLAFIPTMFMRMGKRVREERLLLSYQPSAVSVRLSAYGALTRSVLADS